MIHIHTDVFKSDTDIDSGYLQLTIDIGTEVKYQNKMLNEMVSFTFSSLFYFFFLSFIWLSFCYDPILPQNQALL